MWGPGIEGETPLDNRDGLRDRSILTREQLNVAEAANVAAAVFKYLRGRPRRTSAKFDFPWLLKLHREMFGRVWDWAGSIRTTELNIGVPPHLIGSGLATLLDDVQYRETAWPDFLEQSVHIHHEAVRIHPFRNGNGRWSRMLANIWLKLHGCAIVEWPAEIGAETSSVRAEYLVCVRQADDHEMQPLLDLHRRFWPG